MPNLFNSVENYRPAKNVFDLSHDHKVSFNMGELIPALCMECIPGDSFNLGADVLLRMQPLIAPIMHRCDVYMHFFFVPNRLVWDHWEEFITNTPMPGGNPYAHPTVNLAVADYPILRILDYMDIPNPATTNGNAPETVSALPFAGYQLIWNEFYRDQNLQPIQFEGLTDGDNSANPGLFEFRYRAWEHDYFTAALPFAQKGDPVTLPLGQLQDIRVLRNSALPAGPSVIDLVSGTPDPLEIAHQLTSSPNVNPNELYADTTELTAQAANINDLRRAFRLQEWLEKQARGGSRYSENIHSFFGIRPQDARLNRPEYIVGSKAPVVISEVLNNTGTTDAPQGAMAGHAVSVQQGKLGRYFCQEHGYIFCIMSCMPKTGYFQGIPRHFLKYTDPFQYYWPQFANIGEQEVENRELYAFTQASDFNSPFFGYVPRYAEYKYLPNRVAGQFRTTLNQWHMAREFEGAPSLQDTFITCDATRRIFAVTDPTAEQLLAHVLFKIRAVRAMPKFGTPTF